MSNVIELHPEYSRDVKGIKRKYIIFSNISEYHSVVIKSNEDLILLNDKYYKIEKIYYNSFLNLGVDEDGKMCVILNTLQLYNTRYIYFNKNAQDDFLQECGFEYNVDFLNLFTLSEIYEGVSLGMIQVNEIENPKDIIMIQKLIIDYSQHKRLILKS